MEKLIKESELLDMVDIKGKRAYKSCKAILGRKDATNWLLKMIGQGKFRPLESSTPLTF